MIFMSMYIVTQHTSGSKVQETNQAKHNKMLPMSDIVNWSDPKLF
jgi:hypothetical protein